VDLLELARVLSSRSLDRTLVLLISTGEEFGCLGVRSYLNQLSEEELAAIRYAVNIDMIGYDVNSDGAMELWSGDHPPSLVLAQMLGEKIPEYQLELEPSIVTGCD
jgi:putative aminopeptidase FrvX